MFQLTDGHCGRKLQTLMPNVYVKAEFENLEDKTGKIQKEYEVLQEVQQMKFTHEIVFSSTQLLINIFEKPDTKTE